MDFIGNPWNGVLGHFDSLKEEKLSDDAKERIASGLQKCWNDFFSRVEIFKNTAFEPTGEITIENLGKILTFKNKNPLKQEVVEELNALYNFVISKK